MTTQQMRVELAKKYNEAFVKGKSDMQIIAIYGRLKSKNEI